MVADRSAAVEPGQSGEQISAATTLRAAGRLTLSEFDWAGLVEKGFFQGMITGYVGAGLGLILFESQGLVAPGWLLIDVGLSVLCAVLAFARVWKTIREEHETSQQWDAISQSPNERVLDRVFEIPYLFSILVLPFAAIAPQAFMLTLIVFYFSDNFYNAGLARGAAARVVQVADDSPRYVRALVTGVRRSIWLSQADTANTANDPMVAYFVKRSRFNTFFMTLLAAALVLVTWFKLSGLSELAGYVSVASLTLVLVMELFVEPLRNVDSRVWGEETAGGPEAEAAAETRTQPSEV
jgi:hypothetical protein